MSSNSGVYGLFSWSPNGFVCRYVGKTDNLRRRLAEHYRNPPASGITHYWVAETGAEDKHQRSDGLTSTAAKEQGTHPEKWLFAFSAIQAVASLGTIFVYFGIIPASSTIHLTFTALPSIWWFVAALALFFGSISFAIYGLYRTNKRDWLSS